MPDQRPSSYSWAALGGFVAPATQAALDAVGARAPSTTLGPVQAAARHGAGRLALRLVPGLGALGLAVWIWELNQRANYHDKVSHRSGAGPGEPGYMPAGYRFATSTDLYGPYPAPPLTAAQWNSVLAGNPVAYANGGPHLPVTKFWDVGTSGLVLQSATINPVWNYVAKGPRPTPSDMYGVELWQKDATGPGSLEIGFASPVEWQPQQQSWPLSPDVTPSVSPALSPFAVPPGRLLMPIPQRLIWRVGTMSDDVLIERVSISPRKVPDVATVSEAPPRFRPEVTTPTAPDAVIDPSPGGGVSWQPPSHQYAPPGPGVREVKLRASTPWLVRKVFGVLTETHDTISAIHKALPKRCRKSRSWKGADGKWHRALATSMIRDIKNCAGDLNVQRAIINVVSNAIQDAAIGLSSRTLDRNTGRLFGTTGIQGAGTRLSRAEAGSDSHWSTAISNAGDWVAAQSSGWTVNQFLSGIGSNVRFQGEPRWKSRRRKQRLY